MGCLVCLRVGVVLPVPGAYYAHVVLCSLHAVVLCLVRFVVPENKYKYFFFQSPRPGLSSHHTKTTLMHVVGKQLKNVWDSE